MIQDLIPGVRKAIVAEKIVPVLMISAAHNIGNGSLLTFLADVFPHPDEHEEEGYTEPGGKGNRVERKYDDSQPLSIFVFKTMADPFAGRINYFKVKSGVLKNDATATNFVRGTQERMQHIQVVQGKALSEVGELHAGDIGAIAKLKDADRRRSATKTACLQATDPEPAITFAVGQDAPMKEFNRRGYHKILEEDTALRFHVIRRQKNFYSRGQASSTSKSSLQNCTNAIM